MFSQHVEYCMIHMNIGCVKLIISNVVIILITLSLREPMLFVSLGIIVKRPFFDPLRDEALYDDGEFWEVSVCLKTVII